MILRRARDCSESKPVCWFGWSGKPGPEPANLRLPQQALVSRAQGSPQMI